MTEKSIGNRTLRSLVLRVFQCQDRALTPETCELIEQRMAASLERLAEQVTKKTTDFIVTPETVDRLFKGFP